MIKSLKTTTQKKLYSMQFFNMNLINYEKEKLNSIELQR